MLELLADARPTGAQLGFGILSRMLPAAPRSSGLLSSPPRLRPEHAVHLSSLNVLLAGPPRGPLGTPQSHCGQCVPVRTHAYWNR
jgi:hypothetical protein